MLEILILAFSVLANLLVGLFVYQKNSKSVTSKIFALLTFALSGWAIVSYFSVNIENHQLFFIRLTMFFVILMNSAFFFLVQVFPLTDFKFSKKLKAFATFCAFALVVSLSPFLFTDLETNSSGGLSPVPGPGILSFIIHAIVCVIGALYFLGRRYFKSKGQEKSQLRYFFAGAILMFTLLPLTNFILPLVFGFSGLIPVSPVYTAIFTGLIAYAIIKHKLFDIRLIVARSVAYLFSLGFLALIYVSISVFILNLLPDIFSGVLNDLLNLAIFLIAVLTYPKIKLFFDKNTSRLFFRDSYDPQEFLDELNKSIVRNIEIGILLRHSTAVIENNLHTSFCQVALRETENVPTRIIGTKDTDYSDKELDVIKTEVKALGTRTVITEEIPVEYKDLKAVLSKRNIDVLVHLTESSYGNKQTIAYIFFGAKKSGNVYSSQDLKIIDIIADELVIAIQNALRFEEIQEFNVTLQKKVNDATGKLRKTNEKLKAMDETKDEFISMASHQLRTPLTSVKGYLSMVLEGDAGEINENQKKLLDQAFVSSQRMVYLIADLLNVSRLRTGKFVIDAHPCNLADVVESEIAQLVEQAKAKNQTLSFEKPSDFPLLTLDETKIRQVIMNFADNALFYTPSGGKIKIELTTDKNHVYFAVKDNGIGVPKDEQKHMFTKFYRAKNARSARPDGTGLGLFMAKKVITAQGGNILFESSEGKGSTFGFSFNKKHLSPTETQNTDEEAKNQNQA